MAFSGGGASFSWRAFFWGTVPRLLLSQSSFLQHFLWLSDTLTLTLLLGNRAFHLQALHQNLLLLIP